MPDTYQPSDHPSEYSPFSVIQLTGRVLLADDGPDNRELVAFYLRRAGLEVTLAADGKSAVRLALESLDAGKSYDLILMDMQMPELDGYSATMFLRGRGFTGPIIALTAHAVASHRDACLQAGCTDYLGKPITLGSLVSAVARHLPGACAIPGGASGETDGPLLSRITDPSFQSFLDNFVGDLPGTVRDLRRYLDTGDRSNLFAIAHQLKGSGGTFGFPAITAEAARLEDAIQSGEPVFDPGLLGSSVNRLILLLRRVDGYESEDELAAPPSL